MNFRAKSAQELTDAFSFVQGLIDQGSGLDDLGKQIRGFAASISATYQQLLSYGISSADATRIAGGAAINQFADWRRQLTGQPESLEDQKKRAEADRQLFNAELKLYRLQLEARKAYLQGLAAESTAEIGLAGEYLKNRAEIVRGEGGVLGAEIGIGGKYVEARAQITRETAAIWQAEIDAINAILNSLPKELGINDIHLDGIGKGLGKIAGAMDDLTSALIGLAELQRDMLTGPDSPLTGEQKFRVQQAELYGLMGKGKLNADEVKRLQQLIPDYLASYRDVNGSAGSGYFQEFVKLQDFITRTLQSGGVSPLVDVQKALGNLFGVSMFPGSTGVQLERTGSPASPLSIESKSMESGLKVIAQNTSSTTGAIVRLAQAVEAQNAKISSLVNTSRIRDGNRIPGAA